MYRKKVACNQSEDNYKDREEHVIGLGVASRAQKRFGGSSSRCDSNFKIAGVNLPPLSQVKAYVTFLLFFLYVIVGLLVGFSSENLFRNLI